jgi:hypothetical protein
MKHGAGVLSIELGAPAPSMELGAPAPRWNLERLLREGIKSEAGTSESRNSERLLRGICYSKNSGRQ